MKFKSLPNLGTRIYNAKPLPTKIPPMVKPASLATTFGELNPNETNLGSVAPGSEGSPVNNAWEPATTYKGYQIDVRPFKTAAGQGFNVRVGGSTQVCAGVAFPDRESAVGYGRQICDYWETGTPPSPPTGSDIADNGTKRSTGGNQPIGTNLKGMGILNAGTKEGFKKAEATKSASGAKSNADAAEHYKQQAIKQASGRFAKGNKPDLDKAVKSANLATGAAVVADASAREADTEPAYDHGIRAHLAAAAAHKAARGGAKGDHDSPCRKKEAAHLKSAEDLKGLKATISKESK